MGRGARRRRPHLSAPIGGGYTNASSNAYLSTATRWSGAVANSDGGVWSIDLPGKNRGTLRIERTGNQICVSLRGESQRLCAPDTAAAPAYFSMGPIVQSCAATCGNFVVRLSNVRLSGPTRVIP